MRAVVLAGVLYACLAVLPGGAPLAACAETAATSEYAIKAAFLYKFLFFVTWPDSETTTAGEAPLVLGIVGEDPFGNAFGDIENTPCGPGNRVLCIRRFGAYRDSLPLDECQLLFICTREKTEIQQILAHLVGRPVLVISEHPDFLEVGGMINLVLRDRKVRWEINQAAIQKSGLRMQAQLLRNAVRVVDNNGGNKH